MNLTIEEVLFKYIEEFDYFKGLANIISSGDKQRAIQALENIEKEKYK